LSGGLRAPGIRPITHGCAFRMPLEISIATSDIEGEAPCPHFKSRLSDKK
jgi:hypothetical protein